jgi:NAD(P)-dependent dehydrogenase (short-subunit alcohol dehydrogenase family)
VTASAASIRSLFDLTGRVAVVTGGTGSLGQAMARGLGHCGARVAILARHRDSLDAVADQMRCDGIEVLALAADVLQTPQLAAAHEAVIGEWGRVDVLINAAGGNQPAATVPPGGTLFDLEPEAVRQVVDLNLMGTFLPIQEFGRAMAEARRGSIVNVSSMAATRPLSRVAGYGAAKAAVENLTRWLADHTARRFGPHIRVNAIAPGFFLGAQNRALLVDTAGSLTDRGRQIISATPMGRLGDPEDLVGPVVWLASDASRFVTGAVVPVDGGFSAGTGL